ncbi:MAG TPA: hypothetical protein VKU00_31145 [Chthonomonadaceae bacterium]|nr:hypothetical protein [Chthonomonadaceae bacterium]
MLRINLLPPYINERGQKRNYVILWVLIVGVLIAGFFVGFNTLVNSLNDEKAHLASANDYLDKKKKADQDIADEKQRRAAIEAKQVFVANAKKYNDGWSDVYDLMVDVTTQDILLHSMSLDGTRKTVNLTGFAKDEPTVVRWWMELRNKTQLFDLVSFSIPPAGYNPEKAQGATGGRGMNPFGGMPGGMGGMPGSGSPSAAGPTAAGPMGMGPSSAGGGPGMMGFGGRGGGMGGNNASIGPTEIEGKQGINFAAACVLKKALADGIPTPSWPPGGGATGGPMGGMGMGGMGGPPSGMSGPPAGLNMGPGGGGPPATAGSGGSGPGKAD